MTTPCSYDTVCFVDAKKLDGIPPIPAFSCKPDGASGATNYVIQQSVSDKDLKNIFISTSSKTIPIGYSKLISLSDPNKCVCIKQKSKNFYITFKGKGSGTDILSTP